MPPAIHQTSWGQALQARPAHCTGLRGPAHSTVLSHSEHRMGWDLLWACGGGPGCTCLNLRPSSLQSELPLTRCQWFSTLYTQVFTTGEMWLRIKRESREGQILTLTTLFLPELRPGKAGCVPQQLKGKPRCSKDLPCACGRAGVRICPPSASCRTARTNEAAARASALCANSE